VVQGAVMKHQVSRDIKPQIFGGHDLDRLRSRDVIGHVTIRPAVGGFLYVIKPIKPPSSYSLLNFRTQSLDILPSLRAVFCVYQHIL